MHQTFNLGYPSSILGLGTNIVLVMEWADMLDLESGA